MSRNANTLSTNVTVDQTAFELMRSRALVRFGISRAATAASATTARMGEKFKWAASIHVP
jgi:post-segregation antitoxin (ccd killing protein)